MLSGFWEEALGRHFDGSSLLTPVIHAQTSMSDFIALGTILSHGYLLEGYLPVRVAFPSLATMLLGQVAVPENMLVSSFADSLSTVESQLIKSCLTLSSNNFSAGIQAKLINLLSRFGSRQIPTPTNLKQQIVQVAKFQFLNKPIAAHLAINSGIPPFERSFWCQLTISDLYSLYLSLSATPSRVLDLMEEPDFMNPAEERVYSYLRDLIGNFSTSDTRKYLRFVTGSAVLSSSPLKAIFNAVSGLARRPIAHTCDNTIELSTDYSTYSEFSQEMMAILSDNGNSWAMDLY